MLDFATSGLPIAPRLDEIAQRLVERRGLALAAEPGAGKTSLVPLRLAAEAGLDGKVLVLEPRRLAAAAAAARMAELLGEPVGRSVGYRVRLESWVGRSTRVIAMTPGILLRMIQADPSLEGVGALVFDEFHERSLQADLCFALALEARALRPDLAILAMSATLDVGAAAALLDAPAFEVPGRGFPVATRHVPIEGGRGFEERFAALAAALSDETDGDVLAFLPGAAEIDRARRSLDGSGIEGLALHGTLPLEAQRRVLRPAPGAPRRVVFATSVAETSLTVERIAAVLDSGLARLSRFHARSGLNRLVTEREARDRADQRRGRAGRLGPGLCVRAWPEPDLLEERTEPEMLRAELSSLVLEAAVWGSRGRSSLPFIDPPPETSWEAAAELLAMLGALDPAGAPTERGKRMAALGTEARLAAMVAAGAERGRGEEACVLAALLSERGAGSERDLGARLESLADGARERPAAAAARGGGPMRVGTRGGPAAGGARDEPAAELARRVAAEAGRLARIAGLGRPDLGAASSIEAGSLLAAAFPDRVAQRAERPGAGRPGSAVFRLPSGRFVEASGPLASAPWIVAVEADAGAATGTLHAGLALGDTEARRALTPLVEESVEVEWRGMGYRARRLRRASAIVLGETALGTLPPGDVAAALAARVAAEGLSILPWDDAPRGRIEEGAADLLARLRAWAAVRRPGELALGDTELAGTAGDWLAPYAGPGPGPVIDGSALRRAVSGLVPDRDRAAFEREAPRVLALASDAERRIEYAPGRDPAVEARVQDLYGTKEHPLVLGRPVLFRLLSPAGRPVQVTADLPGFWRGAWAEVRKELRGRYPKHDWPEDPWNARPRPSRPGRGSGRGA